MRKALLLLLCACLGIQFTYAQKDPKLSLGPAKSEWFRNAKFGMFIHWGLYSVLEGSYNGRTMPDKSLKNGNSWYAEWIQTRMEIPAEEYRKIKDRFNPTGYNAEEWVLEAKNAGIRYIVITSKHHDGFALWDSKASDFDIMSTPYKKDLLQPLVDACKKHGMKYGFYYSHWLDWEHPQGAMPRQGVPAILEEESPASGKRTADQIRPRPLVVRHMGRGLPHHTRTARRTHRTHPQAQRQVSHQRTHLLQQSR